MKKLLVVVDYQRDFVDGALGFAGAEKLAPVIVEKIRAYKATGADVVATMDTHTADYLQTREGRKLPVEHCLKGSDGWELYGEVAEELAGCRVFEKPTFGSGDLFDFLRASDYDEVELCGLVSNICVISNAILAKAALPEARIIVDSGATASFDGELHAAAMMVLGGLQVDVDPKA